jgi:hypothetical protein
MSPGVSLTLKIAAGLVLAAFFPLLGVLAGAVLAGMALNAHLTRIPPPQVGEASARQLLKELEDESMDRNHNAGQRRLRGRSR